MNTFFFKQRHLSRVLLLLIYTSLFICFVHPTAAQNTAIVLNTLTQPDLGITASVSLIDLTEPNENRAVANEIIPIGIVPENRKRAVGLAIHGHLAYIPTFNLPSFDEPSVADNVLIVNLETRAVIGDIPIPAGANPQQVALIDGSKMYVTCSESHEVHVVDIHNRYVTKRLAGPFNKPTGITLLNGKAYVTNAAWVYDPATGGVTYFESSVTVIDTSTDTLLRSIPVPVNAGGILNDGEATILVKTTGNYSDILGSLVLIDADTDTVVETIDLKLAPGSFAMNAEKQVFIQGDWQNPGLLIYDLAARDWIRDKDDTLAAFSNDPDAPISGGLTFAPDGTLYITQPDWSGSGQDYVRVMDTADASLLQTYHVGPGASILGFAQVTPRRADLNNDGFVDIQDVTIASRFFGDVGADLPADINGDGVVNVLDLLLIK